jgi:hypothetical protein
MLQGLLLLIYMLVNSVLYGAIVYLSFRILFKIRLQLNFLTKTIFWLTLAALALRILFTMFQWATNNFKTSPSKQYFLYCLNSVVFVFYLNNVTRVISSWLLIGQRQKHNN